MSQRAERLHASLWQGVLYITGGGTALLSELLTTPGASATVLEARVPYAGSALAEILGRVPEQACSDATARALAMAAFQRARQLGTGDAAAPARPFGLACTASLASNRTKRGAHRAHVALQTEDATYAAHLGFEGSRDEEEAQLLELLWHALDLALDLDLAVAAPAAPMIAHTPAQAHWRQLILGQELAYATAPHTGRLLMPGAFNPLHRAHRRMLTIAEEKVGLAGAYELSIVNVDKPFLDYTEIDQRLRQFDRPVWVTRLPTFLEKARRFRGAHFAIGIDTLIRIVNPAYYGGPDSRDRALAELSELGTRFVVFGRVMEQRFVCLSDLDLPEALRDRCVEVTRTEFDEPLSSTTLRTLDRGLVRGPDSGVRGNPEGTKPGR
jgi:nicotinamide mononucleotide (NMN) deamidase PncC